MTCDECRQLMGRWDITLAEAVYALQHARGCPACLARLRAGPPCTERELELGRAAAQAILEDPELGHDAARVFAGLPPRKG